MIRILFVMLMIPSILLAQGITNGTSVYYLDESAANDLGDGKSPATAWKTMGKVNSTLGSESNYDTVLTKWGTYTTAMNLSYSGGSRTSKLVVMNYGTHRPKIDVDGGYATPGWSATSSDSNQILQGFEIESDAMMYWNGAVAVEIRHCFATHPFNSEIYEQHGKIEGSKWCIVHKCTTWTSEDPESIWDGDAGDEKNGLSYNSSTQYLLVDSCVFKGQISHYNMTTYGGSSVNHIIFRNCEVFRAHGGSDADAGGGGTTYIMFDNIKFRKMFSSWASQDGKGMHFQSIGGAGVIFRYCTALKDTDGYNPSRTIISGGVGDSLKTLKNFAFYNNTLVGTWHYDDGITPDRGMMLFFEQYRKYWNGWPYMERIWVKNNILVRSNSQLLFYNDQGATAANIDEHDVIFSNNILYDTLDYGKLEVLTGDGGTGLLSVASMESTYPTMFFDNIASAPLLQDSANFDFRLKSTSPAIDAGGPLTLANGSGSGSSSLTVDEAMYFCDGWGMVEGDSIKIGTGNPVGILSISGNTITLETTRTWSDNDPVYYYRYDRFNGSAPDIGAVEYFSGSTPPSTTTNKILLLR